MYAITTNKTDEGEGRMKIGMTLEGGAMRGMYTAGALDVFLEAGIAVDVMVGVSAGALFGVNFLSRQSGRVIRYNKRFNPDWNYMGLLPLLREGNIVDTRYAYQAVPYTLDPFDDDQFRASGVPFYAVVTDMATGEPEYIRIRSVFSQMDVLRASGSMPFVSRPVTIGGKQYLDGGISDSIPFRWLGKQGCEKQIVILTRDESYRKGPMPQGAVKLAYRKYPQFARRLLRRHVEYNQALEELKTWEKAGKAFVLRPSRPIEIGRIEKNPEKLQAVYDLGQADARRCLPALKEYLA